MLGMDLQLDVHAFDLLYFVVICVLNFLMFDQQKIQYREVCCSLANDKILYLKKLCLNAAYHFKIVSFTFQ